MRTTDQMTWAHSSSQCFSQNCLWHIAARCEGVLETNFLHNGMGLFLSLKNLLICWGTSIKKEKHLLSIGIIQTGKESWLCALSPPGQLKDKKFHLIFQPISKTIITNFWQWNFSLPRLKTIDNYAINSNPHYHSSKAQRSKRGGSEETITFVFQLR